MKVIVDEALPKSVNSDKLVKTMGAAEPAAALSAMLLMGMSPLYGKVTLGHPESDFSLTFDFDADTIYANAQVPISALEK